MYSNTCYIKTANIEEIKLWTKKRGGEPAVIKDTDILQIKLPKDEENDSDLEPIDWSSFTHLFFKQHCLFLYENDNHSSFYKVIEHINDK